MKKEKTRVGKKKKKKGVTKEVWRKKEVKENAKKKRALRGRYTKENGVNNGTREERNPGGKEVRSRSRRRHKEKNKSNQERGGPEAFQHKEVFRRGKGKKRA